MGSTRTRCAIVVAATIALATPVAAHADAVTDWNNNANAAIISQGPAVATAHAAILSTAMVQGAVYDAVNAIAGGYRPYLPTPRADPMFSQDAAATAAAYTVTKALVPAREAVLTSQYNATLAGIPPGPARDGGVAVGTAAGEAMLAARQNDGRNSAFQFTLGTQPGEWRASPPLFLLDPTPWVGNVKPFLVPTAEMLRTKGPNPLTSRAYARDVNEVKSVGSLTSTTRTADQTMAAIFWQTQPGPLWGGLMAELSAQRGLTTAENARLYAMVSLAEADASIGCWNDKYYWNFWRPIDAIRGAADDGNPRTAADPAWTPLFDPSVATVPPLSTPAFPDHPSGHSCLTGATMSVLRSFFKTDKASIDVFSSRFPGVARHFERFSDVADEVVSARVWGGIHFRTADEQGVTLGEKVAKWERRHYFQRAGHGDHDHGGGDD
jgi:hypothetical protein